MFLLFFCLFIVELVLNFNFRFLNKNWKCLLCLAECIPISEIKGRCYLVTNTELDFILKLEIIKANLVSVQSISLE